LDDPQLIIWPETAFPGYIGEHDEVFDRVRRFAHSLQIPLLLGSVVTEEGSYYNSSVLIGRDGEIAQRYDKLHLVPFGEYIPFRSLFPFLSQIVPIADFSPGRDLTLFSEETTGDNFSTLICFEDSVAGLPRRFVRQGSELLVNITNDAWFKDTKAPYLHLQSSVFRAIENRRTMVRAANTGISGFIAPSGRITGLLRDAQGKPTYVLGHLTQEVGFNDTPTLYTIYGDLFSFFALFLFTFMFLYGQFFLHPKSSKKAT
jgi:apolipoprotein N-acyltransferase